VARNLRRAPRWSATPDPSTWSTTVHLGAIAAGERVVAAEGDTAALLTQHYDDSLAIEMEGFGLLEGLRRFDDLRALVIRGVSDRLAGKEEADAAGWQPAAARFAAEFGVALLREAPPGGSAQLPPVQRAVAPPAAFVGRDEVVGRAQEGSQPGARIALTGLSGVGKSSVAAAVSQEWQRRTGGVVWWVDARADETAGAALRDLAAAQGLPIGSLDPVRTWLAERDDVLLVLDAAPDAAAVARILPGPVRGVVVVTSLAGAWPPGYLTLNVPPLAPGDARTLLEAHAGALTDAEATSLVEMLDGLPLGIVQAGGYLRESHVGATVYSEQLRERAANTLERGAPDDHELTLTAGISLALTQLAEESPFAAWLLVVLAQLAPVPVATRALEATAREGLPPFETEPIGALELYDALRLMERLGLARLGAGAITVHDLTRRIVADLTADDRPQSARDAALLALFLDREADEASAAEALAHLTAVASVPELQEQDPWLAALVLRPVVAALFAQGLLGPALDAATRMRELISPFVEGPDAEEARREHEVDEWQVDDMLDSLDALEGLALADAGDFTGAERPLRHAVDRAEEVGDQRRLARCLNNLSIPLHRAGDDAQALALMERALVLDRAAGADAAVLVRRLENIAHAYAAVGEVERQRVALAEARALIPAEHLGGWGRRAAEIDLLIALVDKPRESPEVIAALRKKLEHSDGNLRSRSIDSNNLALALSDTGEHAEAFTLLCESLTEAEKVWGAAHPEVELRVRNLVAVAIKAGEAATARRLLDQARSTWPWEEMDPVVHAQWLGNEAYVLIVDGEAERARERLTQAMEIFATTDEQRPEIAAYLDHIRDRVDQG
jgi:tetratricopeptide (TPR) repeat protein